MAFQMNDTMSHVILMLIFSILAVNAVILRLYARRVQAQKLATNDLLIVLGLLFGLTEVAFNIYSCCYPVQWQKDKEQSPVGSPLGLKVSDYNHLLDDTLTLVAKFVFFAPVVWVISVTLVRSSVLLLYHQIFVTSKFQQSNLVVLAFNAAFGVAITLAKCLNCRPISIRWDHTIRGHCGDETLLDLCIAIFNLVLDLIVVLLPMPVLWGLQMSRGKKAILTCIFGLGFLICAVTAYRLKVTSEITNPSAPDAIQYYNVIALLTALESLLGIINACLPLLRPVVRKVASHVPKSSKNTIKSFASGPMTGRWRIGHMFDFTSKSRSGSQSEDRLYTRWERIEDTKSTRSEDDDKHGAGEVIEIEMAEAECEKKEAGV